MTMVLLCHVMKWTYQEYIAQPPWFLMLLTLKLELDAKHQDREAKKVSKRHGKRS